VSANSGTGICRSSLPAPLLAFFFATMGKKRGMHRNFPLPNDVKLKRELLTVHNEHLMYALMLKIHSITIYYHVNDQSEKHRHVCLIIKKYHKAV